MSVQTTEKEKTKLYCAMITSEGYKSKIFTGCYKI